MTGKIFKLREIGKNHNNHYSVNTPILKEMFVHKT